MKEYRHLDEHTYRKDIMLITKDPVKYATLVTSKIREEVYQKKRQSNVLTIFTPAKVVVKSHIAMKDMYSALGFTTLIMNGNKKGFYSFDGVYQSIRDFNKQHEIFGEIKDTLVKWRTLNPTINLAITGNLNIERGITFCTTGFNFSDMIVSHYHLENLASLIQLLGRANGGKEYIEIMNIWTHDEVISKANEQISIMNTILNNDPEEFKETDFRKMTKQEQQEPAMNIPIVIQLTQENYKTFTKKGRGWNIESILPKLEIVSPGITEKLKSLKKKQISEPSEALSIKKHIEDFVNAYENNRKYTIDIRPKERQEDLYQIFLDKQNFRAIVSIYYGSKTKPQTISTLSDTASEDTSDCENELII